VVGIRVTDNAGEVAKYITKPGAYLNLDGNGAWWCDPDRLDPSHHSSLSVPLNLPQWP